MTIRSLAASKPVMFTVAARPKTVTPLASPTTRITSSPLVALMMIVSGCAVAGGATERAGEIDVDLRDVGPGQVVDHDLVGAAERIEVDRLDVVEVHGDVRDVAGEQHAAAICRDVDVLGDVGAVEQQRVEAVLAFDGVVVVTRVPDEHVVAGAHEGGVVAVAAVDQVVALAAEEQVCAETAVHRQLDSVSLQARGVDDVVAAKPIERQPIVRLLLEEHVHRRLETRDRDASGVAGDDDTVVRRRHSCR